MPKAGGLRSYEGYTGVVSAFRRAGFVEVVPGGKGQVIMRCVVGERDGGGSAPG